MSTFKKNTAVTGFPFLLVSATDGSAITSGVPTAYVTLDGGTQASVTASPVHEGNGQWSVDLTAGEMNGDVVGLLITLSGAIPVHFTIKTDTKLVSELNDLSAANVNAECDTALADYDAPTKAELDSGLAALNDLDAAGIRTAVGMASANLDTQLGTIDTNLDAVLVDTNELQTNQGDWATATGFATAASLAAVDANVDAILVDTGTTIPAQISGLNDLSSADVNAACDTALADYDAPTKAEMDAGLAALNDLSAAEVNAEVDAALADIHLDHLLAADYDPASKPGVSTALLNELVEDDSGVTRFTVNALENGPSGSGASAAAIADAVWTEALADHSGTTGSTAEALNAAGGSGDPWTTSLPGSYTGSQAGKMLSDILTDTADLQANQGNWLTATGFATSAALATVDANVDAILVDTGTTIPAQITALNDVDAAAIRTAIGLASANLDTQLGTINSNVDAILVDTDTTLPALVAALNDLSAAEVRTAIGLASANLDTQLAALPTATENADALLNRDMSAVSDTNPRSPLNALRAVRNKVSISGGTATVTKEDDSTTAWTSAVTTDENANNITESDPA